MDGQLYVHFPVGRVTNEGSQQNLVCTLAKLKREHYFTILKF